MLAGSMDCDHWLRRHQYSSWTRYMRVALVHDWLTGLRGGEKCLEVLCRAFPDARLFTLLRVPGSTSPAIERMAITTSPLQHLPGVSHYYRWLLPCMPWAVGRLAIPADVDLVVSLSHAVAKGVCVPAGIPHVCYCFTPMRYAWHRRDDYLPRAGVGRRLLSPVADRLLDRLRRWDAESSRGVTHFVAISRTVARRIEECYGRASQVIYPPVDTEFYQPALGTREDYYLCVSALVPYKRTELVIEACRRLGRRLTVIGDGPERARLARAAKGGASLLGWQSNEAIRQHLQRCRALLFAAHEDFGIVPLEAQACGTPVIALGEGGATETVIPGSDRSAGTGLWFGPQNAEALCDAIRRFEAHPEWIDAGHARQNAEKFSTARFQQQCVQYLHRVMAGESEPARFPAGAS